MPDPQQRPIGYWLRRLDELVEAAFVQALGRYGVTRRQWQVLNAVGQGATLDEVRTELSPFDAKDPGSTDHAAAGLLKRGWLTDTGGTLTLSASGTTGLERLGREVEALREAVGAGVEPDDYTTTVRTLAVMCGNLERRSARPEG